MAGIARELLAPVMRIVPGMVDRGMREMRVVYRRRERSKLVKIQHSTHSLAGLLTMTTQTTLGWGQAGYVSLPAMHA